MKASKILRTFAFAALLGGAVITTVSCTDKEEQATEFGTVTGIVTDEYEANAPIAGVTVTLKDLEGSATTGSDGKYTFPNVPIGSSYAVVFTKTGWESRSKTVRADLFVNGVATISIELRNASLKITGTVSDGKNRGAPLAGVSVTVGSIGSATTGDDGKFTIENLAPDNYTVVFAKTAYPVIIREVAIADFQSGVAVVDVTMGGEELLRGKTADDLLLADKWYYNEYRGGRNADAYPHWDWSTNYMGSFDYVGNFEEQNEGSTLRIRNDAADQSNPANLNVFDTYTYGSKLITDDNKIMSVRVRTHNADAAAPAYWGVQVVDLSAPTPAAVKIGNDRTHGSGDYADYHFDLSDYVDKEVIIAVGIYRQQTGDYWKQLVLRAIRFAHQEVKNWDWLPGDEVIADWKLPLQTVRSTMAHTEKTFTGISPVSGNRDNYIDAYKSWRTVKHIAREWSFVPLFKDPEVFPSEGYLIKTRGNGAVNTTVPEAYFYAKFAIASGKNQLTLKTRNFGSNYTFFKLTAIKEDGTVKHIAPSSNTAQEASAAANGCWRFKHGSGGAGTPNDYASFVYDLSEFNGQNVVLAFGVYNGELNGDENKLVFYSVTLQ